MICFGKMCIHMYIFVFIVCFGEYMCTHVFICIHDIFWVVHIYTYVHICISVLRYACGCVCVCTCVHVWCVASGCFAPIAAAAPRNIFIYIYILPKFSRDPVGVAARRRGFRRRAPMWWQLARLIATLRTKQSGTQPTPWCCRHRHRWRSKI